MKWFWFILCDAGFHRLEPLLEGVVMLVRCERCKRCVGVWNGSGRLTITNRRGFK